MRIAHITDPHIRHHLPGPAVIPARRAREAVRLFSQAVGDGRERGADVIAVTGDLVDIPAYLFEAERDRVADAGAWRAVREDYREVRRVLEESGLPWVALPGNHDSPRMMREVFGEQPMVRDVAGVRLVSFWDREHAGHVPRRVLAERRRLDAVLADPDPTPQVHLQHFVLTPERNEHYPHTYLEGAELTRRIAGSSQVALVLSGHFHPGVTPERYGSALFSVTPALTESPHAYRLFDVEGPADGAGGSGAADGAGGTERKGTHTVTWREVALDPDPEPAPAVFLDRDGCINTLPAYFSGPEAMELLPGSAPAIRRLRAAGYRIVVITNQTCVGNGYVTPEILAEIHDRMHTLLAAEGAEVDAVYASFDAGASAVAERYRETGLPHKPDPTMLHRAAETLHLDLGRSFMVGDRATDIEVGVNAGVSPILVRTGGGRRTEQQLRDGTAQPGVGPGYEEHLVVDDLAHAAQAILGSDPAR